MFKALKGLFRKSIGTSFTAVFGRNSGSIELPNSSSTQQVNLYNVVSIISTVIDMLATKAANIKPHIQNLKTKKFEDIEGNNSKVSAIMNLLSTPNPDETKTEFFRKLISFYLISGNTYVVGSGRLNKEIVELTCLHPSNFIIRSSNSDLYAQEYSYLIGTGNTQEIVFKREENNKDRRFRFVEGELRELLHIKEFNSNNFLLGQSKIDKIYFDAIQHHLASRHNKSLLEKGTRLSGLLAFQNNVTPTQAEQIKSALLQNVQGVDNAGGIYVCGNSSVSFTDLSKSQLDMNFPELLKTLSNSISLAYGIPLPLINQDSMTYSNYETANLSLYDNAVLPLVELIYEELSLFLLARFGLNPNEYRIFYNESEISALNIRKYEQIKTKKDIGVYTPNELRAMDGLSSLELGDVIYMPINMVPMGTAPIMQANNLRGDAIKSFIKTMKSYKYKDTGKPIFTDQEIKEEIEKQNIGK